MRLATRRRWPAWRTAGLPVVVLNDFTRDPPATTSDDAGRRHKVEDHLVLSPMHAAEGMERLVIAVLSAGDG